MTPDNRKDAPQSPQNGAAWLSVPQAAAALGVSEKTVWRRAKAGEITARKVAGARGGLVWKIALNRNGQPTGQTEAGTDKRDSQPDNRNGQKSAGTDTAPVIHAQTDRTNRNAQPDTGTDKTDRPTGHGDEMAARLLAQLESENAFLRRALESAQQSEAVTKAALREALKAMPKQLTSGAASGETGQSGTDSSAPETPISSAKRPGGQRGAAASNEAPKDGAALTYDDIATALEKWIDES